MSPTRPLLLLIVGPTGVGKSAIALELAERCNGEILSADSIQVYRGMDIGSAKSNREEKERIPHHCIDLCEPAQAFSVVQYQDHARRAVEKIRAQGRRIIVVGGSGFYLKTFFFAVTDSLPITPEIRQHVEKIFCNSGLSGLLKELDRRHRHPPNCLDRNNARRVMRALERCLTSDLEMEALEHHFQSQPKPFADYFIHTLLVDRPSSSLRPLLAKRIDSMLHSGFMEEVLVLRQRNFEANPSACGAVGYRQMLQFLDGIIANNLLAEKILAATWAFVRRQRTWFRHQIPIGRHIELADSLSPKQVCDSLIESRVLQGFSFCP